MINLRALKDKGFNIKRRNIKTEDTEDGAYKLVDINAPFENFIGSLTITFCVDKQDNLYQTISDTEEIKTKYGVKTNLFYEKGEGIETTEDLKFIFKEAYSMLPFEFEKHL